eukprot:352114-Chlamydomonas_euryale.AAC.6
MGGLTAGFGGVDRRWGAVGWIGCWARVGGPAVGGLAVGCGWMDWRLVRAGDWRLGVDGWTGGWVQVGELTAGRGWLD